MATLLGGTSDLHETPLPCDAELLEQNEHVRRYSTAAATVMELSAAYQHRMIADGGPTIGAAAASTLTSH